MVFVTMRHESQFVYPSVSDIVTRIIGGFTEPHAIFWFEGLRTGDNLKKYLNHVSKYLKIFLKTSKNNL